MTHGLEVRAVTTDRLNGQVPEVRFIGDVGQTISLASLAALAGTQVKTEGAIASEVLLEQAAMRFGLVSIDGNVSTGGDQTYAAGSIDIGSNGGEKVSLYSDNGTITLIARPQGAASIVNGENLNISLGDGGILSQEAIDLIDQSGLSIEAIAPDVQIFGNLMDASNYLASTSLIKVDNSQSVNQSSPASTDTLASNEVLIAAAQVEIGDIQSQEEIGDNQSQEEIGDSQPQEEIGESQSQEEVADDSESEECASSTDTESADTETGDTESADTETGGAGSGSASQC
jgi:hypothetical protein